MPLPREPRAPKETGPYTERSRQALIDDLFALSGELERIAGRVVKCSLSELAEHIAVAEKVCSTHIEFFRSMEHKET